MAARTVTHQNHAGAVSVGADRQLRLQRFHRNHEVINLSGYIAFLAEDRSAQFQRSKCAALVKLHHRFGQSVILLAGNNVGRLNQYFVKPFLLQPLQRFLRRIDLDPFFGCNAGPHGF